MNLKQAVLTVMETEQLRHLCAELDIDADRPSGDAMVAALLSAKRAKPEMLIATLKEPQLRAVLVYFEQPTHGDKDELVQRLTAAEAGSKNLLGNSR